VTGTSEPEAFTLDMSGSGDDRFDGTTFEQAYCLSFFDPIPLNVAVSADVSETVGTQPSSVFDADQVSSFNGLAAEENLDLIRYIVSQDYQDNAGIDEWDVQFAIWELTDNINTEDWDFMFPEATEASVDAILADAAANGDGFEFGTDGTVGAILEPNPQVPDLIEQPFIVGFSYDEFDC